VAIVSSFLGWLVNNLVCYIETAAITVINAVIVAIAAFLDAILAILPPMPTAPTMPTIVANGISWVEYFIPLDWFLTESLILFALWMLWLVSAICLRWAKAIRGAQ